MQASEGDLKTDEPQKVEVKMTDDYSKNSSVQETLAEFSRSILIEAVHSRLAQKLELGELYFGIASYGCATGHNDLKTFNEIVKIIREKS